LLFGRQTVTNNKFTLGLCFGRVVESFKRYAHNKGGLAAMKVPVSDHPISEIMKSGEPYVASDLETEGVLIVMILYSMPDFAATSTFR
jgi:hypothetical protein